MINEFVMLIAENTQYIQGRWVVLNATLTGADTGFFWLKRISHGVATESDLTDYVASYNNNQGLPDTSKLIGVLGEYKVAAFSDITTYKRNSQKTADMPPSVHPVG
jgi:hypothetical protein